MDSLDPPGRPRLTRDRAARLLWEHFGLRGTLSSLASERDQNFRVELDGGERAMLKICHPAEDPSVLALQDAMLSRLRGLSAYDFPWPRPALDGATWAGAEDGGREMLLRVTAWVPGVPLAEARPRTHALLARTGRMLAEVDRALEGLDHPAADRRLRWDLRRAHEVIQARRSAVEDPHRRALLDRSYDRTAGPVAAAAPELRTSIVHNDGNAHNVLVADVRGRPDQAEDRRVRGLVDFGDALRTWRVAEVAIACAYAMLDRTDSLAAASAVVGGYHGTHPLAESELEVLPHLIVQRLCASVCLAAAQRAAAPENTYLSVTERAAWSVLEKLDGESLDYVLCLLRHACGLEPHPRAGAVVRWLRGRSDPPSPVLEPDPGRARRRVFDLSVESLELGSELDGLDAAAVTDLLFGRMEEAGAAVGLGRYDEARRWYSGPSYAVPGEGPERRTLHLGVDLFVRPGTPVLSPLDGQVHSVADNAGALDYGPTVILQHRCGSGGPPFYTLYGHLGPDALERREPGDSVVAGQRIGGVGDTDRNGGWPPHLHFQLIVDLLGRRGDFPGVAAPAEADVWRSLCPDPNLLLGLPELRPASREPPGELLAARRRLLGPSLSVSYREPLKIVRGRGAHLFDDVGRAFVDCVNNVAHVGHCHPRVVRAAARQMAVLNTNTRYLHENLVRYAEALCGTLPEPLQVCFFVCSGSEANELALRMARAHSGVRDVLVVDGAYHGNSSSLVDMSPYKFDGPGGRGPPDYVHVVPTPDRYRGLYRDGDGDVGARYAADVAMALDDMESRSRRPAAFFCESLLSCAGQIVLPDGYLRGAVEAVRAAGGVYVADEVQVGFGRVGTHFWGFETQGVVPDIVTLGKPIGNGHPIGAVVTTREVAASFDTGMEYFNTFGGNPVSCAVGLEVLDVIRQEGLQERARTTGEALVEDLRDLQERHPLLGDVRGLGLFLGVELVVDPASRTPATAHATHLVERMRQRGFLLSTDGPDRNVVKIKPPLVLDVADAARLVETLDAVLVEDALRVP